jgi:hypothetical protein
MNERGLHELLRHSHSAVSLKGVLALRLMPNDVDRTRDKIRRTHAVVGSAPPEDNAQWPGIHRILLEMVNDRARVLYPGHNGSGLTGLTGRARSVGGSVSAEHISWGSFRLQLGIKGQAQ